MDNKIVWNNRFNHYFSRVKNMKPQDDEKALLEEIFKDLIDVPDIFESEELLNLYNRFKTFELAAEYDNHTNLESFVTTLLALIQVPKEITIDTVHDVMSFMSNKVPHILIYMNGDMMSEEFRQLLNDMRELPLSITDIGPLMTHLTSAMFNQNPVAVVMGNAMMRRDYFKDHRDEILSITPDELALVTYTVSENMFMYQKLGQPRVIEVTDENRVRLAELRLKRYFM